MLDTKFTCTVTALVIALVALCTVEATSKSQLVEGWWGGQQRVVVKNGSQLNVNKDAEKNLNLSAGDEVNLLGSLKDSKFYTTQGYQPQLLPSSTYGGAYAALKNATQEQVTAQAEGAMGFNPSVGTQFRNAPNVAVSEQQINNDKLLEASTWSFKENPKTNIVTENENISQLGTVNQNTNMPLNLTAEDHFRKGHQMKSLIDKDYKNGVNTGTATNAYLAENTDEEKSGYIKYVENARPAVSAEHFTTPGSENYSTESCIANTGCDNCPETKNNFVAQPLMKPDYANGNYNEVERSVLRPATGSMLPIGTMESIDNAGVPIQTVNMTNLMFANPNKRQRGGACQIRGDVPPCINLSSTQNGMFVTSQSFTPSLSLHQGALPVLAGMGSQATQDIALAAAASGTSTSIGGTNLTQPYLNTLVQQQSTLDITQGLQPQATAAERINAGNKLAIGQQQYMNANASHPGS